MFNRLFKKLDLLIIKAFIGPFVATFFITLFVLVLQFFWLYIDDIVGKGVDMITVGRLILYVSATLVPLALPLAVLLSSIMTFGNLGETFELIAIKSAGISLLRFMRPLLIISIIICYIAFLFNNNIIPIANLKMNTLKYDIIVSKPAFDIKEGVFYDKIEGYVIKIGKKEKDDSTIRNVVIYQQNYTGQQDDIIIAEKGKMVVTPDKHSLVFALQNGWIYQEGKGDRMSTTNDFIRMGFKEYKKILDLSSFKLNKTEDSAFKNNYQMLTLNQLGTNIDSLKKKNKIYIEAAATNMRNGMKFSQMLDTTGWADVEKLPQDKVTSAYLLTKPTTSQTATVTPVPTTATASAPAPTPATASPASANRTTSPATGATSKVTPPTAAPAKTTPTAGTPVTHIPGTAATTNPGMTKKDSTQKDIAKKNSTAGKNAQTQLVKNDPTTNKNAQTQLAKKDSTAGKNAQTQLAKKDSTAARNAQARLAKKDSAKGTPPQTQLAKKGSANGGNAQTQLAKKDSPADRNPPTQLVKNDPTANKNAQAQLAKKDSAKDTNPQTQLAKKDSIAARNAQIQLAKIDSAKGMNAQTQPAKKDSAKNAQTQLTKKTEKPVPPPPPTFRDYLPDSVRSTVTERAISQLNAVKIQLDQPAYLYSNLDNDLRVHRIAWHEKLTLSVACLVMFLIGAPLGSIIRKGGIGMPLVFAVVFFVIFFLLNNFGKKFVKEDVLTPIGGMWMATYVLTPIGLFLVYKALHDSQLFNKEFYFRIAKAIRSLFRRRQRETAGAARS